jgi:RNA polymerase sigma-70 factor, ECF subfamily
MPVSNAYTPQNGRSLGVLNTEGLGSVATVSSVSALPLIAPSAVLGFVVESSSQSADTAMDRYAAGDDDAFSELYDALWPRLYRYALALGRNPSRAEDLVQQTLEILLRRRGQFTRGARVMPWAFAILRNQFRDQEKRPKIELLSSDGTNDEVSTSQPDPQTCTESKQLQVQLRTALGHLSPLQRQAFELLYYGEMTYAEIAEVLDTTVAGVKSRIQRAQEVLRTALHPVCGGDSP